MKAAIIKEYGGPDVVHYEDIAVPDIQDGEILIKVAATTFNPADAMLRGGMLRTMFDPAFPYTLGVDVAGVVERVANGVTNLRAGDRVYAMLDLVRGGGSAEFVTTNAFAVALAPASCSLTDAAALAGAGLTAWQALIIHGNLQAGQRVLVTAAAGGVGTLAVQIAKARGCHVIGTASPGRFEMLRAIGADKVVDYSTDIAHSVDQPVDLVLNLAPFTASADPLLTVLKRGGTLVTATLPPDPVAAERAGVRVIPMAVQRDAGHLREIAGLVDAGQLRPVISQRLSVADTAEAHRMAGNTFGKVVLIADPTLAELKG